MIRSSASERTRAALMVAGASPDRAAPPPLRLVFEPLPRSARGGARLGAGRRRGPLRDLVGLRFGRLLILGRITADRRYDPVVLCECDCGSLVARRFASLRRARVVPHACAYECAWGLR